MVFDAVLQAYEEIVASFRRSGAVSILAAQLPGILDFACRYAGEPDAKPQTLRVALKLVGALAAEFPAELAAMVRCPGGQPQRCVHTLAMYGATCPSKAMRDLAASLAQLLPPGLCGSGSPVAVV